MRSALQDFAAKYNQLQSDLHQQEEQAAGVLAGDTVVTQLQTTLRQIASYAASGGSIHSLSDLGLEFDSTGTLSLNQTTFDQLSDAQLSAHSSSSAPRRPAWAPSRSRSSNLAIASRA